MNDGKKSRRRRSSSLLYQEPPESMEHMVDQAALPNLNANWVNAKGVQTLPFGQFLRAIYTCFDVAGRSWKEEGHLEVPSEKAC
jgi:hypothetical protein